MNALYDLLNLRYMDVDLQDSRDENEHSALIRMIENIHHDSIIKPTGVMNHITISLILNPKD